MNNATRAPNNVKGDTVSVRHIVLFELNGEDDAIRQRQFDEIAAALRPLDDLDGVESLRVDADPKPGGLHWHLALVTEHESMAALASYQAHPRHQEALKVTAAHSANRAIVDYEL